MLWDANQLPAYRQCAADFARRHPGTTVKVMHAGWGDYWTAISTGFIAGVAPDVFVNHVSKAPQFASNDLLVDLAPLIRRDGLNLSAFPADLLQVWGRDRRQFGLPKDWDTVALMVNLAHARKAGVSLADRVGERYQRTIATLWHAAVKAAVDTPESLLIDALARDAAGFVMLGQCVDRAALQHGFQQVPAVVGHQLQQRLVHGSQRHFGIGGGLAARQRGGDGDLRLAAHGVAGFVGHHFHVDLVRFAAHLDFGHAQAEKRSPARVAGCGWWRSGR